MPQKNSQLEIDVFNFLFRKSIRERKKHQRNFSFFNDTRRLRSDIALSSSCILCQFSYEFVFYPALSSVRHSRQTEGVYSRCDSCCVNLDFIQAVEGDPSPLTFLHIGRTVHFLFKKRTLSQTLRQYSEKGCSDQVALKSGLIANSSSSPYSAGLWMSLNIPQTHEKAT